MVELCRQLGEKLGLREGEQVGVPPYSLHCLSVCVYRDEGLGN